MKNKWSREDFSRRSGRECENCAKLPLPSNVVSLSSYVMSNGYKPAPYNLSSITLNPKMEKLVELLAENAHNVWARDRIEQGWTYGLSDVRYDFQIGVVLLRAFRVAKQVLSLTFFCCSHVVLALFKSSGWNCYFSSPEWRCERCWFDFFKFIINM